MIESNPKKPRVPMFTWRMAFPVLLFGIGAVAVEIVGLPHIRASYDYVSLSARPTVDPRAPRRYTRCDYFGPYGWFRVMPTASGDCAFFEWRRRSANAQ